MDPVTSIPNLHPADTSIADTFSLEEKLGVCRKINSIEGLRHIEVAEIGGGLWRRVVVVMTSLPVIAEAVKVFLAKVEALADGRED